MAENTMRRNLAILLISIITILLLIALQPYYKAIFGALILYTLFIGMYKKLIAMKWQPSGASSAIILLSFVIIIVPITLLISMLLGQIPGLIEQSSTVSLEQYRPLAEKYAPGVDIDKEIQELAVKVGEWAINILVQTLSNVTQAIISLIIMYVVLHFMLTNNHKLKAVAYKAIPFNTKHVQELVESFSTVTKSTIISTGIIAVMQGALLGIGFAIFGFSNAFFWAVVGVFLSFIPLIGIPLIWIPAGAIAIVNGDMFAGVGILIYGAILSNVDNFLRPYLQKKIGDVNPVISFVGVFIGLPLFGMLGLIIGPLLLSYFILTIRMFHVEHLDR